MILLVNAANLHHGGGVSVASSLVDEFSRMPDVSSEMTILASSEVDDNLRSMGTDISRFGAYFRFNYDGVRAAFQRSPVRARQFDVVFNVFGPSYALPTAWRSVTGFAQPWIAFPDNLAYSLLPPRERILTRIQFEIMALFFLLPAELIVEQAPVRAGLHDRWLFRRKRISVVSNVVDSVFFDPERWESVELPDQRAELRLGVVARNYLHKNLSVFPDVKRSLKERHGIDAQFLVTLNPVEWAETSPEFREEIENVGPLRLAQCPMFYRSLDGVVFPTLLECFSATPLESRAVGTPLFASDIPVVRATVGDYGVYFNPTDPADIADKIAENLPGPRSRPPAAGLSHATEEGFTSEDRAKGVLAVCRDAYASRQRDSKPPRKPRNRQAESRS